MKATSQHPLDTPLPKLLSGDLRIKGPEEFQDAKQ